MSGPRFNWEYDALQKVLEWSTGTTGASQVDYMGFHRLHDAPTSEPDWYIFKYTWAGNEPVRIQGPLTGAWDDHVTLGW
jgi:hypothetical protein